MRNVPQHIIDRARELPRQGNTLEEAANAFDESLSNLTGKANNAVAGIGKFIQMAEKLPEKLQTAADNTKWLEDRTQGLQKAFGLNIQKATEFYAQLAKLSDQMGVGATQLAVYSKNLSKLVGGFANLSKSYNAQSKFMRDMLEAQTIMQTNLGLSADQANKFTKYAALQGKSATDAIMQQDQIAKQIREKIGYEITTTELMEDIAGLGEDVMLQYGKMPENLALAVTKAKLLGLSMEQLKKTGEGFLNIESSIGDELEYQLLSGRRLVNNQNQSLTNLYRQATLQGDGSKQAELMSEIVAREGDTIRDNLFARQQLAKTLGTDEATLAKMLAQQELLSKLQEAGMDMVGASSAEIDAAIAATTDEEKKKLLEQLKASNDQRTTQEQMQDSLDVMVATMIKAFGAPDEAGLYAAERSTNLMAAMRANTRIGTDAVSGISRSDFETMGGGVNTTNLTSTAAGPIKDFLDKFKDGIVPGITSLLQGGIETLGGISVKGDNVTVVADGKLDSFNDVAMGPGVGRIISGPEGAFRLNDRDSIIAGTNLFDGGGGSGDMAAFAAAIVSAINNQTDELTRSNTYWS